MLNNKGQMRVVETILASFIIVFALTFANIFAASPTNITREISDLEKMGYSVLHDLDQHEILGYLVYNEKWSDLRAALKVTLPADVYFNITICDLLGNRVNNATIFYGDTEAFTESKNIVSLSYSLIGYLERDETSGSYEAIYSPRVLVLQLVRG